ncbi:hypothetical protein VaNZ11_012708 [Volvox africanus]|uniref:Guanylate cyclase domain-containing protein n=1 Tax=Volvox africanus TaxID=51714 RepID=A0ABQ5SEW3_9CHLO|nr:hypothetical protein VaNZ11_012708 [Volvox africanus]
MESTGQPGAIHASESAFSLLKSEAWEPTGGIEIKGKGLMQTFVWRPTMETPGTAAVRQLLPASSASAAAAAAAALKVQPNGVAGLPLSTDGGGGRSSALLRYTTTSSSSAVNAADGSRSRAASSVIAAAAAAATLAAATPATATTPDATSGANTIAADCQTVDGIHMKTTAAAADCCNEDSDPLVSMLLSHVD